MSPVSAALISKRGFPESFGCFRSWTSVQRSGRLKVAPGFLPCLQGSCCLGRFLCQWHPTLPKSNLPWIREAFRSPLGPNTGTFQVPAPGDIHCIDHLCSSHLLMVQTCFFPQHLSPGHLPKYSKLFVLKSQPILTLWTVSTVWGPRWGNSTGANSYPPAHTHLINWVHMTD